MARTEEKGVKVVLDLKEGTQTVSGCNLSATDDQLYALAMAVAQLEDEDVVDVTKVVETTLMADA